MSTALGIGKKLEDFMLHTEVFDTPGSAVFNHPNPGQALDVIVTLIGGGGGGGAGSTDAQGSGNDGTAGTNSVWDTSGSPITALAGSQGFGGDDTANLPGAHATQSLIKFPSNRGTVSDDDFSPTFNGSNHYGYGGVAGDASNYIGGRGGVGEIKTFTTTVTGNVNLTIGAGGTGGTSVHSTSGDGGPGGNGAIIVQYAKASAGIPAPIAKEFVEEWIDKDRETADSGVWVHPNPGQAIDMTVICIGGAGGNSLSGTGGLAGSGGNTVFDTLTALGGNGGNGAGSAVGAAVAGGISGALRGGTYGETGSSLGFGLFGGIGSSSDSGTIYSGSSGGVKMGRITVTGNVSYSVGAGGAGDDPTDGAGLPGGIILKYSK